MTKAILEKILTEYGVTFTDALADRLMKEFDEMTQNYCHTITCLSDRLREVYEKNSIAYQNKGDFAGMTNGEVFQATFPCEEVHINGLQEGIVHFSMKSNLDSMDCFSLEWWNAPYKEGGE